MNAQMLQELPQLLAELRGDMAAKLFGEGTPEQMEEAAKNCIQIAAEGGAYIMAPGCSVPHDTPMENIRAFWEAGLKYGCYQN